MKYEAYKIRFAKLTATLLICATLLASFASCASDNGGSSDTSDASSAADTIAADTSLEDVTTALSDNLPDTDLGGRDFTILARSEFKYEFASEGENGDLVNDAVFQRNSAISERFNVNLGVKDVAGSWSAQDTFKKAINDSVLAGDGAYDLVAGAANYVMAMTGEGAFLNLTDVDHIDFERPWWSQAFVENMSVGDQLYLAVGDVALTSLENMCTVLFNKKLMSEYELGDPYALVNDGKWTFEKMMEMASGVTDDLNGDSVMDINDRYGLMTYNNMIRAMSQSFGIPYTQLDSEGYPEICYMSDRLMTAFDKVASAMKSESALNYTAGLNETLDLNSGMQEVFKNAQVLFMTQVISSAQVLRTMEVDFGILPYPMLDESQGRYYTTVLENLTAMGILTTVKDESASGLILEALAFEGYSKVTPTYFETALKDKYARDAESEEMLNIIRESIWFDFGYINSSFIGGINAIFATSVLEDKPLASEYEANIEVWNANLEKMLDAYKDMQ